MPGASRPATGATPVSRTATSMPSPLSPAAWAASAPIMRLTCSSEPRVVWGSWSAPVSVPRARARAWASASGETEATPLPERSVATLEDGTRAEKPPMMPSWVRTSPPSRSTSDSGPLPAPAASRTITGSRVSSPAGAPAAAWRPAAASSGTSSSGSIRARIWVRIWELSGPSAGARRRPPMSLSISRTPFVCVSGTPGAGARRPTLRSGRGPDDRGERRDLLGARLGRPAARSTYICRRHAADQVDGSRSLTVRCRFGGGRVSRVHARVSLPLSGDLLKCLGRPPVVAGVRHPAAAP